MVDSVLPTQGAQVQSVVRELRSRMPHGEAKKKPKHTYKESWIPLTVQWLRIRLPMQGTWVRSLIWEDSICQMTTTTEPMTPESVLCNQRSHRNEKPVHSN